MTYLDYSLSPEPAWVRHLFRYAFALGILCQTLSGCSGTPGTTCSSNSAGSGNGSDPCANTGGTLSTGGAGGGAATSTGGTGIPTGGSTGAAGASSGGTPGVCACTTGQTCLDQICRDNSLICSATNTTGMCASGFDCRVGVCVDSGAGCSAANPAGICPVGMVCRTNACQPLDDAVLCDDRNPCTTDTFDNRSNRCIHTPVAAVCSDGNECTTDTCVAGVCQSTPIASCVAPPHLNPVVSPTSNGSLILSGDKPSGASIEINGSVAVSENPDTTWQVTLNLSPGPNTYSVRSVRTGQASANVSVTVVYDVAAPVTTITPKGGVFLNPVTATVSTNEPARVYYTTDGGTPDQYSPWFESMRQFRVFDNATLRFRARDGAGNWEATISEATFEISSSGNRWTSGATLSAAVSLGAAAFFNGTVYLAGGVNGTAPQAGFFGIDVSSGTITALPSLSTGRAQAAMVVHGGSVYLIGGQNQGNPLNTVQRFTPGGTTWDTRSPMPSTRFGIAAVSDGTKIYVLGGKGNGAAALTNFEVYDPTANSWSNSVAQLPRARYGGGAVYQSGIIYVVGGEDSAGTPIPEFDIYNVAQNTWTTGPALPTPRSLAAVTLNRDLGKISGGYSGVVVAGGLSVGAQPSVKIEEYVIDDGVWRERRPLDVARYGSAATAVVVGGPLDDQSARTWLLGGQLPSGITDTTAVFAQDQDYVRSMANMPSARFKHAAVPLNGTVYLFGGRDYTETTVAWAFDPETEQYSTLPTLPSMQNGLGAVAANGKVYAIGGADQFGNPVATFSAYDPSSGLWQTLTPMPTSRRDPAAVVLGDDIYVIGGDNGGALQTVEIYSLTSGSWRSGPILPVGISGGEALAYQGNIYLMAGQSATTPVSTAYRFATGSWSAVSGASVPLMNATALRVHDRQVALIGGRDSNGLRGDIVTFALDTGTLNSKRTVSLLSPHEFAAAAAVNGDLFLFGGNYTSATQPPGSPSVYRIDSRCFNGVKDGRETDVDSGGTCPTQVVTFTGVQVNVPAASLAGWTTCWSGTYNSSATIASIQAACTGANLMLACRTVGSTTFTALAHAPRADVFYDTGTGASSTHAANGVNWYYNSSLSWGFVQGGEAVSRNSCDTGSTSPTTRVCWHTSGGSVAAGYRCGSNTSASSTIERLILQAN